MIIRKFNFKQLESDKSVYKAIYNNVVYLALYVDDGLIMSEEGKIIQLILNKLGSMVEIKVSESQCFVGLEIKRNQKKKTTFVSQGSYISRILKRFNMENCRAIAVSTDPSMYLSSNENNQEYEKVRKNKIPYREAVGNLMFAAIVSCSGIMYTVGEVSRFLNNRKLITGRTHWTAVKRILRYLQGTQDVDIL